jgi:hypothetical protein
MNAIELVLLTTTCALGVAAQRLRPGGSLLRRAWTAYFWTLTPALVFFAFSTVSFDRDLTLALAAAILASWLVIGAGLLYARWVSDDPAERGTLALAASFPNTGFVGYPLAQIAFGAPGLALMVVYDRLAMLVPGTAVSTAIARIHSGRAAKTEPCVSETQARTAERGWLGALLNPPLLAMAGAVVLRAADVEPPGLDRLGRLAGDVIGPAGFFLLGLSLPLDRVSHGASELRRAAGALAIRFAVHPLVLLACGFAFGIRVPNAFLLAAALPCAFHLLILARVYGLRVNLMRLLVVTSTVPAVIAVVAGNALF